MKKSLLSIVAFFSLVSCTNEIPLDYGNEPSKLIVNALLDAQKQENKIVVALTGHNQVTYITDARIKVFVNEELKEEITAATYNETAQGASPGDYFSSTHFVPGDKVKIEVSTADSQFKAWGEALVPSSMVIERIDTTSVFITTPFDTQRFIKLNVTFTDNANVDNYYRIAIERIQTVDAVSSNTDNDTTVIVNTVERLISREDVVLTDGRPTPMDGKNIFDSPENKYGVFDNSRINGRYTMSVSTEYYPYGQNLYYGVYENLKDIKNVKTNILVHLLGISEGEYYYLRALNILDSDNSGGPFNEAIKLPSNITGGIGIVGISTGTSLKLDLQDYKPVLPATKSIVNR
ncbi:MULTISPECIES: DUF4249 domain-containing protein [Bacteroides]|uniref:DUF4249 domain-containing protein n=1 Tax=Bacteroides oleiciplenus YIT 12058 TaxID=742727 RepID=K9ET41_9BACE|nr:MULTISPECIES: DUF4249 domain-containing protein [Bacteroides]EKU92325.1 hypothetical protein HMPREF9447_00775 [Bacteroides oleiciplenus YIT 12058]